MPVIRLALAQVNPTVGALEANRDKIAARIEEARRLGAMVVVFPELVLTGYPPEDLLLNGEFVAAAREQLERLVPATQGLVAVVGAPLVLDGHLRNAAALLADGRWADTYAKGTLPNYGVFDEKRYFRPGLRCPVYSWDGPAFGINICEDLWVPRGVPERQAQAGARWLWNLSSSPYHAEKGKEREALLCRRARTHRVAIAYCNLVGGQDELVFDGEALLVDAGGTVRARGPQFQEALVVVDVAEEWLGSGAPAAPPAAAGGFMTAAGLPAAEPPAESIEELESQFFVDHVALEGPALRLDAGDRPPVPTEHHAVADRLAPEEEIYRALVLGLHDYCAKNGFSQVVLGLSGGIDSALTAALAADALGADRVTGISMPTRFNSATSRAGAAEVGRRLGIRFREIPIDELHRLFLGTLAAAPDGPVGGVTSENIQARIRATLLMAVSNAEGSLLLTTGNKSELAVGYCTLYGDMAGGFAALKDVPKTLVYRLARFRNSRSPVIPEDTLTRPPSAELRENQVDQDTLPPYELLDRIVQARMEHEEPPSRLVAAGLDRQWVQRVYRWIDGNEFKRRQAPPGVKITPRSFGRDRRYPISNGWRWSG